MKSSYNLGDIRMTKITWVWNYDKTEPESKQLFLHIFNNWNCQAGVSWKSNIIKSSKVHMNYHKNYTNCITDHVKWSKKTIFYKNNLWISKKLHESCIKLHPTNTDNYKHSISANYVQFKEVFSIIQILTAFWNQDTPSCWGSPYDRYGSLQVHRYRWADASPGESQWDLEGENNTRTAIWLTS